MFSSGLSGQGVYNNGARIVIGSGVSVNINGTNGNYRNETNVTDGLIDLSGKLAIAGNLTNNATADVLNTAVAGSTVILSGTTTQTLGGTSTSGFTLPNLTVNNPAGIVITKNAQVNGTMTFTNGLVDIGNNNFTFGALSAVAGSPSASSMIIATGSGKVQKSWTATGTFTYPVGDNNITAKYSPVTLSFTGGTFAAGALAGVNLVNARYNDPFITVSYLNRFWNITQTGITAFTSDAVFQYVLADVTGTESAISNLRMLSLPITAFNPANPTLHQLSATGLTSFGTFTGGPGIKTLNLKLFLEGLYKSGGLMNMAQGVAGNQYTGTTVDKITVELHDPASYANLITSIGGVLNTNGSATIAIPAAYNGSYYVAVKHRNSVATVTSLPLLFSSSTINYDFTTSPTKAYGANMKNIAAGINLIFEGDVNQDNIIDFGDAAPVDNKAATASSGYIPEDVNGDGLVDFSDAAIIDNNAASAIGTVTPP